MGIPIKGKFEAINHHPVDLANEENTTDTAAVSEKELNYFPVDVTSRKPE